MMIRVFIRQLLPRTWQPYFLNMGWLLFGRSVRLALGFTVGVWVARYLGPSDFGLLNFVTSIVALVSPLSQLGLEQILTRERVRHPDARTAHLGSAFGLRGVGLFIAYAILALYIVFGGQNSEITLLIGIASLSLPFHLFSVVDAEYQARIASRYSVWVRTGALFVASGLRIAAILGDAPLMIFIWLIVAENLFMGLGWWIAAEKHRFSPRNWHFDPHTALYLWKDSRPVLLATFDILFAHAFVYETGNVVVSTLQCIYQG
ncbi:oligosaccharide flippase family protein [candidate division KSB1 bacterium]|nr:oligosaccharide flippase family protein [candidate division KSB1 bacterium]